MAGWSSNPTTPSYAMYTPDEEARKTIQPQFERANQDLWSTMQRKGLMNSSMAANNYATLRQNAANAESLLAQELYRNNRDFQEQQRQYNTNAQMLQNQFGAEMGLKIWDAINAREVAKWSLPEHTGQERWANDPSWFNFFQNTQYQPIQFSPTGPTGDANVETWTRHSPAPWKSSALKLQERESARADEYLKLQQQYAAQNSGSETLTDDEKWTAMADAVRGNRLLGLKSPGKNLYPTDLFESFNAEYGIDIVAMVKAGDPRAINLVKSAYADPRVAELVIRRMQGNISQTATPSWKQTHYIQGGGAPAPDYTRRVDRFRDTMPPAQFQSQPALGALARYPSYTPEGKPW